VVFQGRDEAFVNYGSQLTAILAHIGATDADLAATITAAQGP
jgi:hypothetical protein